MEKVMNSWMELCPPTQCLVQAGSACVMSLCSAASSRCPAGGNIHPTVKPAKERDMFPSQGMQRRQKEQREARSVGRMGAQDPRGMERGKCHAQGRQ